MTDSVIFHISFTNRDNIVILNYFGHNNWKIWYCEVRTTRLELMLLASLMPTGSHVVLNIKKRKVELNLSRRKWKNTKVNCSPEASLGASQQSQVQLWNVININHCTHHNVDALQPGGKLFSVFWRGIFYI